MEEKVPREVQEEYQRGSKVIKKASNMYALNVIQMYR
jgi:hypothetical protein